MSKSMHTLAHIFILVVLLAACSPASASSAQPEEEPLATPTQTLTATPTSRLTSNPGTATATASLTPTYTPTLTFTPTVKIVQPSKTPRFTATQTPTAASSSSTNTPTHTSIPPTNTSVVPPAFSVTSVSVTAQNYTGPCPVDTLYFDGAVTTTGAGTVIYQWYYSTNGGPFNGLGNNSMVFLSAGTQTTAFPLGTVLGSQTTIARLQVSSPNSMSNEATMVITCNP